jgi:hypothetical protein
MALADNVEIDQDDRVFVLRVVDCGELVAPSGCMVICDPYTWLTDWAILDDPTLHVAPGRYRVLVTQADVSSASDGSHLRNAYATLLLADTPEVRRIPLAARADGILTAATPKENGFALGVDSKVACFIDLLAVSPELPIGAWQSDTICADRSTISDPFDDSCLRLATADEDWWEANVFDNDREDAWYRRFSDPTHLGKELANVPLPLATDGANAIIFRTGWGDGHYAVVGGYDAADNLVRVHIDFQIVNPPIPFWLGRPPGYDDEELPDDAEE